MVDVENHVAFAHVKVPGDDGGGVDDLNQDLDGPGGGAGSGARDRNTFSYKQLLMDLCVSFDVLQSVWRYVVSWL